MPLRVNRYAIALCTRALAVGAMLVLAACTREESSHWFPLQSGMVKRYDTYTVTALEERQEVQFVRNLGPGEAGVLKGKMLQSVGGERRFFTVRDGQWLVVGNVRNPEVETIVLPLDPQPGQSWQAHTQTRLLEAIAQPKRELYQLQIPVTLDYRVESLSESVETPAGRFENCLRLHGRGRAAYEGDEVLFETEVSVEQTEWYARDVGLIALERHESTETRLLPDASYKQALVHLKH